jgi:hypothetical protein
MGLHGLLQGHHYFFFHIVIIDADRIFFGVGGEGEAEN